MIFELITKQITIKTPLQNNMFMMQPHRRSNRRPRNNKTTKDEAKARVQAFIEANIVEKQPGKLYRKSLESKEEHFDGFEYNKEMYMANDRYATMIERELIKIVEQQLWDEAQKKYAEDEADHKDKFESKSCD